ncbi:UPF0715 family protein [Bacillus subtilis]|uniref:UPF0715 family protein n=1 Tax=Bacillus subtilis TaxID=1423 RepID=UPI0013644E5C|nr:UPF0715 family protein [Bacillus subtilis]QHJ97994.1 hypothetical protein C7M17_01075 [Bacillus subtilis]WIY63987.1 UPF0715 family protein [Bacillus subtilis]
MKKTASYYLMTLGLSSLTFGWFLGFYSFVMYGDMIIALFTAAIALLYGFVVYGLFAVPLQMKLQKKARTFNVMYLLIYSVVAFIAAFLFFVINEPASIAWTLQSHFYYMLSIAAAVIYWLWDSLILYKRTASGV